MHKAELTDVRIRGELLLQEVELETVRGAVSLQEDVEVVATVLREVLPQSEVRMEQGS